MAGLVGMLSLPAAEPSLQSPPPQSLRHRSFVARSSASIAGVLPGALEARASLANLDGSPSGGAGGWPAACQPWSDPIRGLGQLGSPTQGASWSVLRAKAESELAEAVCPEQVGGSRAYARNRSTRKNY
jgi:hypothetical protein